MAIRQFETGATRDTDHNKHDYEGFLSPLVIEEFGRYMTRHRVQSDGSLRESDNWQKGIPLDAYMKSGWRHFFDWWMLHRVGNHVRPENGEEIEWEDALCGLLFNVQGYLHELLMQRRSVRLENIAGAPKYRYQETDGRAIGSSPMEEMDYILKAYRSQRDLGDETNANDR
jgi:hypothetical protein